MVAIFLGLNVLSLGSFCIRDLKLVITIADDVQIPTRNYGSESY